MSLSFGGPTFEGSVVRVCALRKAGVVDASFLNLSGFPNEFFEALLGNGSIGQAVTIDRQTFGPQNKLEPALVYRAWRKAESEISLVGERLVAGALEPHGSHVDRQREFDVLAHGYGTNGNDDPWFDARRAYSVVAVQAQIQSGTTAEDIIYVVPISDDAASVESLKLILETAVSAGAVIGSWGFIPNLMPVPGDGMLLSWVQNSNFRSVADYASLFNSL